MSKEQVEHSAATHCYAVPTWKTWLCTIFGHKEGNILHIGDFRTRTKCGRCQKNIVRSNTGLTPWVIDEA